MNLSHLTSHLSPLNPNALRLTPYGSLCRAMPDESVEAWTHRDGLVRPPVIFGLGTEEFWSIRITGFERGGA